MNLIFNAFIFQVMSFLLSLCIFGFLIVGISIVFSFFENEEEDEFHDEFYY